MNNLFSPSKYLSIILWIVPFSFILMVFNNCGTPKAQTLNVTNEASEITPLDTINDTQKFEINENELHKSRNTNWAYKNNEVGWEYEWNAIGAPSGPHIPNHMWWDNPHDDDFNAKPDERGACRYRYNYPEEGMMYVNRINTPDGQPCPLSAKGFGARRFTGNIWRRDRYLIQAHQTGATFEFDVNILNLRNKAQDDAFYFSFVGTHGSFSLYLSPNCIKIGPLVRVSGPNRHKCTNSNVSMGTIKAIPVNTEGMNKYRVVLHPRSQDVDIFMNKSLQPILSGTGGALPYVRLYKPGSDYAVGDAEYEFPYILLGDNVGDTLASVNINEDVSAAYILGGIRYTRGVFSSLSRITPPIESSGPFIKRSPPPLPRIRHITKKGLEFDKKPDHSPLSKFRRHFSGDALRTFKIGSLNTSRQFVQNPNPPKGKGVLKIDNSKNGSYIYQNLPNLYGNAGWIVELRAQLQNNSDPQSFALSLWDRIGMVTLILSTDKVELAQGGKFKGRSNPVMLDTTNAFHTYRLVRKANDLYVYLYIDDNPVPRIFDFRLSGTQMNGDSSQMETRLWFGWQNHLLPQTWKQIQNGEYVGEYNLHQNLLIDHIRWDRL